MDKIAKFSWIQIVTLAAVFITVSALGLTILKPGLPSGHDINAHALYTKLFHQALSEGQFPVRWSEWVQNGFSLPLFNFYQVGFYYLANLINLALSSLTEALKLTVLLLWWLGGIFAFLLFKRFGLLPGAAAALTFVFTPYLISDIFVRAAYPELTAISFSAGLLWALDRLLTKAKVIYALPLSLFIAIVLFSHLPTFLILTPVFLGYSLLLLLNHEVKGKGAVFTAASLFLGIGMAAFYIFPAIFELDLVKRDLLTSGYYNFRSHFVYPEQIFSTFWGYGISQDGNQDGMSFQLGFVHLIIIAAALITITLGKILSQNFPIALLLFWLLVILYGLFFIHDISVSFWENIQTVRFIQYPWRFLMVVPFSSAALAAVLIAQLKKSWHQSAAVLVLILGVVIFYKDFLKPATFLPDSYFKDSFKKAYLEEGYLPKGVAELPSGQISNWAILTDQKPDDPGQIKILEKTITGHYFALTSQNETPIILRINSHYFPGWKAYLDNIEASINSNNSLGFMDINVPSGIHKIELKFTNTPIRSVSNTITALSLFILIIWQLSTIPILQKIYKRC